MKFPRFTALHGITAIFLCATTVILAEPALPPGFESIPGQIPAPTVALAGEDATGTSLQSFRGKVLVVNVWATWCAPCVKEMPSLDSLAERVDPSSVIVIGVSQDRGGFAVINPFVARIGLKKMKILADPTGRLYREFSIRGLPSTFIIDKTGRLVSRFEGFTDWDRSDVQAYIHALAASP